MKFTFEVNSAQPQAKNWIVMSLKRNLTGENKSDILSLCREVAKELRLTVKLKRGIYVFSDKKGLRQ